MLRPSHLKPVWTAALSAATDLAAFIRSCATNVFGHWTWQKPAWLGWIGQRLARAWRYLRADRKRTAIAGGTLLALVGSWLWYANRPKPHYNAYTVTAPGLTEYDEKGISSIKPLVVTFAEPAAPLQQIEKEASAGIKLTPKLAGTWTWTSDRKLSFMPKADWPIDQEFNVAFARDALFAPGVRLDEYDFDFHSQPLTVKIASSQFYQDPRDPKMKKLVATVQFSHPVDPERFEERVALSMEKEAEYLGLNPDSRNYTVAYDKFKLAAYVHSAPLSMPRDDTKMTLTIDKGVRAARGGNETSNKLQAVVVIPGRTSLRFSDLQMTLVDNARYEPEQVFLLTSSSPVAERALAAQATAYLLPVRHPAQKKEDKNPHVWFSQEIGGEIMAASQPLALTYVSSEEGGGTSHGFKFQAPPGRYVYVLIREGVDGIGGYISGKPFTGVFQVKPYPQTLSFLGQGALLSLSGDRKIGFMVRDVNRVQVEVGRVLPNQLQHLAPEMWNFSKPSIYPGLSDKMVERFTEIREFGGKQPGKPSYDSIDLGRYLRGSAPNRGLLLLRLSSAPRKSVTASSEDDEEGDDLEGEGDEGSWRYGGASVEDSRLVLITDLGFLVKESKDGSRDVFVQSIHTGQPVAGARVEVLGRNGLPVVAATTDDTGRAALAKFGDWRRERAPLMIVVQKESDYSFMPFQTSGRALDLSRFDTGGVANAKSAQELSAYLFTDRGIYRPGETAHIGLIARTADWRGGLEGLPLEFEIIDPRGVTVSRNALKLSAAAFEEFPFTTQPAAPTGTYEAAAFLVRSEKKREMLGSTTFKVQEFEPDRMKVQLDLSERSQEGWLKPSDITPRATVAHLFGEPAAGRRVEAEMSLTAVLPAFPRYPDHRFYATETLDEPYHEVLSPGVADEKGVATFRVDLNRFAGRAYRLNILARAFEAEGGRNVAAQNSAIVSDAAYLIGVKPDGDLGYVKRGSVRSANWIAVSQSLAPVAAGSLTLEWVQRKYVSVLTQQYDRTYKYVSRLKEIVRDSRKVSISAGGSNLALPTQEPGDFKLVLRDASGAELNRLSYSVAGDANLSKSLDRDAELQVRLDKASYAGGETIEVSIRAPYNGSGLITVERERVYRHRWFKTSTTSTVQRIQLPPDFEGNGYVSVQFVRDPASQEIFISPLSYGVAAFSANLSSRKQTVDLAAPPRVKPGSTLSIRVAPSEPSRVAVLAVDEGILQVARHKSPDPLAFFFQKKSLEVRTTQILDLILPEFKRFMAMAAAGGDADGGFARHLNPFARKRKPPVAYWSGIVDAGPGGKQFRYTVPDYFNGRLRIAVISVSSRKIGTAQSAVEVKGDYILTPNVPAMVAPGDEFTVSVGVFNNSGGSGPVRVQVQPGGGLTNAGPAAVDLQIAAKKEGAAEFRLKANAVLGSAPLTFSVKRGASQASMEETVSVRPVTPYRTQLTLGRIDGGSGSAILKRDLFSEKREVDAAVSTLPITWGYGLTVWLEDYPYLCTEQLISKGFSALLLASRPELGSLRIRPGSRGDDTMSALQTRQNESGGFGLWSSSPETAEFPTVRAAHYLVEAKERGRKVPPALLESVNGWLARFGSTPAPTLAAARARAYAVYLLARQGVRPTNALANVEQELSRRYGQFWQTDISAAWLAATYRILQRNSDAEKIIARVPWSRQKRIASDDVYYGSVVHDAELLYILARHFPARLGSLPATALQDVANVDGITSLSASSALLALDAYATSAGAQTRLAVTEIGKDGKQRPLQLSKGAIQKAALSGSAARVQFTRQGGTAAYYVLRESGFDRNAPAASNQGIEVFHEFLDMRGNVISKVRVGDEFLVRIRVRATKHDFVPQVAIVDMLPGGTEAVLELRPPAESGTPSADPASSRNSGGHATAALPIGLPDKSNWHPQYVDVRDDRIVLYGDISKTAGAFVYRVRAASAGVFQAPPAFAESLYDPATAGISSPGKLEIVKP